MKRAARVSIASSVCSIALVVDKRETAATAHHGPDGHFYGRTRWGIPKVTKAQLYSNRGVFETKGRDKWDYDKIDEQINNASEFRDKTNRDQFFEGPKKDNSTLNTGSMATPKHYRLHEYFEEYTKPGTNKKVAAALAVREQWKMAEFPSEKFAQERPGFRGVPKELLNRNTYYGTIDTYLLHTKDIYIEHRARAWVPTWPPPGYKMQRMQCKKEYTFGVEDHTLVAEVERFNWYKAWVDQNQRMAWIDVVAFFTNLAVFIWMQRNHGEYTVMKAHLSGVMYPGRHFIRTNGTPKNWETDCFWFQRDLKDFPLFVKRVLVPVVHIQLAFVREEEKRIAAEKMAQ